MPDNQTKVSVDLSQDEEYRKRLQLQISQISAAPAPAPPLPNNDLHHKVIPASNSKMPAEQQLHVPVPVPVQRAFVDGDFEFVSCPFRVQLNPLIRRSASLICFPVEVPELR